MSTSSAFQFQPAKKKKKKKLSTNSSAEELGIKSFENALKVSTFDRRVSRIARCKAVRGFFFLPMNQKLKLDSE